MEDLSNYIWTGSQKPSRFCAPSLPHFLTDFILTHVFFLFWTISSSGHLITSCRGSSKKWQRQPLQHCHAASPFSFEDTRQKTHVEAPSLSHIAEESHCTLWRLSITEPSALGSALTDKGKCFLRWGVAVDLSPHLASVAVFATPCLLGSPPKMQANAHQQLSVPSSASESFLQKLVVVVVSQCYGACPYAASVLSQEVISL